MRQRNIPDYNKVSTPVQTDINLIKQPLTQDIDKLLSTHFNESSNHINSLIRSQTDSQLLDFFRQEANYFRGLASLENVSQDELRKRLIWIQGQIEGLEKRKLIVNGINHANYYAILSDVQGKLDKQCVINNNYEPKLKEAQLKIDELEKEIEKLRRTVYQQNYYKTQNELYEQAFKKLSDITKDQRRMREIQKTVNDQIVPLINQYDVKLDAMIKNMNNLSRSSNDPKYKLKGQISGLLRNMDKLIKSTGQMTLENVQKYICEFLKELEISQTYQQYESRKSYKHQFIELERKFNAAISMFRNKFESLLEQNPSLSNQIDFSIFNLLERDGVNFYNFDRVVTVQVSDPRVRTVQNQVLDQKSKQYLLLFASQFKHIIKVFPLIKQHLSAQLLQILNLQIFQDAMDLQQINRIFQVVKYKPEIVKVENVYTYNNQAHLKTIFHLKILIKSLLDQLNKVKERTGVTLQIDEGLLNMIKSQIIQYVNPDDVIRLFRSLPKILEVEKIVERNLSKYQGILTEAHPITVESVKVAESVIQRPVVLKEQVGVIIEKGIPLVAIHEKPIQITVDRIVQVPVEKEVLVQKVIIDERIVQIDVPKQVYLTKQQIKQVPVPQPHQIIVQVPQLYKQEIAVVTKQIVKEIVEVEKFHERLVEVVKQVTSLKEVKIIQQVPVQITKFMEVQKIINNFVPLPQIIQIKEQVPITVTNTIEKPVEVIETIEKIIQTRTIQEKIVQVPVQRQIALIQQVPKPYKQIQEVFIKGDKQQIIVQVEKIVQKPIIHQVIKVVEVQRERIVPVIVQQDKPIIVQLKQPYIQNEVQIVTCEIERIVPYKQQIPIQIVKQVPVHIVCEKEVIKPTRIIVQKVIEKIVEVPRVIEVEKIVQKIVVVPRVIENIVLVPQIVQKIVEREVQVLKIIQIQKLVPYYIKKQIQQIVQEKVEVPIEKVIYNTVEKEKMVVSNTQTQVIVEVQVEKRVPYEVIRQKQVLFIKQKIQNRVVTLNNTEIKQKQVMIPIRHEIPVELITQKAVEVKKVIDNVIQVPQVVTKNTVLYETITIPEIHEIIVEKLVETIKEVVYTNVNNLIEIKPQYKQIIREVLVKETQKLEILKPEPYYVEKIVVVTNIEQEAIEVKVEKGVPYRVDNIVPIEKSIIVPVVTQIPKIVNIQKVVQLRTIYETLKEVPIEGREKTVVIETVRPQIVEMTKQVIKVLVEHQEKDVFQQVAVVHQNTQIVEVPAKPIVVHEVKQIYRDNYQPLLLEKVIERVTLLPQIVQVMKHIHEITEERIEGIGLGIAGVGIDIQVHTTNYVQLCTNLRKGLQNLLLSLRNARSSEVKAQVSLIEQLVVVLGDLIRFPNIIQIPKIVEKVVQVQKPIVVPTKDNKTTMRQIAANTLIEKLLIELKRVRSTGVQIKLDNDILNTFFIDLKGVENLSDKIGDMGHSITNRFKSLGQWTHENSIMLNNFLQQKFLLSNLVKQSNKSIERLKNKLQTSETNKSKLDQAVTKLNILNLGLKSILDETAQSLSKSRRSEVVDKRQLDLILTRINTTISQINHEQNNSINERISSYQDNLSMKKRFSELQKQVQSYRGGESERSRFLNQQNIDLRNELQNSKLEITRLKTLLAEYNLQNNSRQTVVSTTRVEDLNQLLTEQKIEYDRAIQKLREEFSKRQAERPIETRVITSTIDRSEQEEKQRQVIGKLELRIRDLENELVLTKNRQSRMTVDLQKKGFEYEDLKRKLTERETVISELDRTTTHHHGEEERLRFTVVDLESKIKQLREQLGKSTTDLIKSNENANIFRSNLQKSELQQSQLMTELKRKNEEVEGMKNKLSATQLFRTAEKSNFSERQQTQNQFTSPDIRKKKDNMGTFGADLGTISPVDISEYKFSESSGTDKKSLGNVEYKNIILFDLMKDRIAIDQNISSKIIIKICEKLQTTSKMGLYLFYTPENIKLINFAIEDLDKLSVEFGAPIKVREAKEHQKKYLSPQALKHTQLSEQSCVFNIGVIWDQMLHGEQYFKTSSQIQDQNLQYKVRNVKMNPIFKNALFEILVKDAKKRLNFNEIKRRLSLQRYITTDTKKKN